MAATQNDKGTRFHALHQGPGAGRNQDEVAVGTEVRWNVRGGHVSPPWERRRTWRA